MLLLVLSLFLLLPLQCDDPRCHLLLVLARAALLFVQLEVVAEVREILGKLNADSKPRALTIHMISQSGRAEGQLGTERRRRRRRERAFTCSSAAQLRVCSSHTSGVSADGASNTYARRPMSQAIKASSSSLAPGGSGGGAPGAEVEAKAAAQRRD